MSFDTSWDVNKYRYHYELPHHWELKKKFMLFHKNKYPEERLVCLAQIFCNVHELGCRYGDDIMELIDEMTKGITERNEKFDSKSFSLASDAVEERVKAFTGQNKSSSFGPQRRTMEPIAFVKSTEPDHPPLMRNNEQDRPAYARSADQGRQGFGWGSEQSNPGFGRGSERGRPGFGRGFKQDRPGFGRGNDQERSGFGRGNGQERPGFGRGNDQERPGFGRGNDQERSGFGRGNDQERPGFGRGNDQERSGFGRGNDQERPGFGRGNDQERSGFGRGNDQERPGFGRGNDQERLGFERGNEQERPGFGRGNDQERPGFGRGSEQGRPGFGRDFEQDRTGFGRGAEQDSLWQSNRQQGGWEGRKRGGENSEMNGNFSKVGRFQTGGSQLYSWEARRAAASVKEVVDSGPFGKLVVFQSTIHNDGAVSIIDRAARASHMNPTFDYHINNGTHFCKFSLDGMYVSDGEGPNQRIAKEAACKLALERLRETSYTIEVKAAYSEGERVERDTMGKEKGPAFGMDVPLAENNIGSKMLKMMGWCGGGLGKDNQGIEEPITPYDQSIKRGGLGITGFGDFRRKVTKLIEKFAHSTDKNDLVFSPDFSKDERKTIHELVRKYNLRSRSYGKAEEIRHIVIFKKIQPLEIVEDLLACGGETEKYKLIPPNPKVK